MSTRLSGSLRLVMLGLRAIQWICVGWVMPGNAI